MANEPWLTTREAAKMLGVHPGTLANWRVFGNGPAYKETRVGKFRFIRYRREDIEKFMKGKPCQKEPKQRAV
jgi:predicted site-specific integrase-resolvase